jgi:methylthioribulose-1-phosphate dehydratase
MPARPRPAPLPSFAAASKGLVETGRRFYGRGWVMGTSGNFSVVVGRAPLQLAITASSLHKGTLVPSQILRVDERGRVAPGRNGRPSAEMPLHLEIVRRRGAGAVLHTHSVWSTMLSERHSAAHGFTIEAFEMLKGLDGVTTHEHKEWIPIVTNDQDTTRMAAGVGRILAERPDVHAFLIRRHGLYTWGRTLAEAERHVEILEFLFETIAREGVSDGGRQHS